jgi:hypothetical protein
MKNKQTEINVQILLALFNATMEQMETLTGDLKHQTKYTLNKFKKSGKIFESIVNNYIEQAGNTDHYNEVTDVLHDAMTNAKKEISNKFLDNSID